MPIAAARDNSRFGWLRRLGGWLLLTVGPGLLIVLAGLLVYSNSFSGPFVFDDLDSILANPTIHRLWPLPGPLAPPGGGTTVQGRPIVNLSLAINYALGGEEVWGYHAFNLAIHLLAGLVLFGVVRRTLQILRHSTGELESHGTRSLTVAAKRGGEFMTPIASTGLALAIALLWTVHPLLTKSVTYIIQRAESMMALCYLLTLYGVIRGAGQGGSSCEEASRTPDRGAIIPAGRYATLWYIVAVVSCLLGAGCKEVIATAPLVVLLYDRQFLAGSFAGAIRRRWGLYAGLATSWLLVGWLVASASGRGGTAGFGSGISPLAYGLMQLGAIVTYLRLSFWPDRLVFYYGTPVKGIAAVWPAAAVVLGLLLATIWGVIRRRWWGFLGASFFLILGPSSSVVPVATETVAEHRMYLPLAAVVALVVTLVSYGVGAFIMRRQAGRLNGEDRRTISWTVTALGVIAVLVLTMALGWRTISRNEDYRSAEQIWRSTAENCPTNPVGHNNLGVELVKLGGERARRGERDDAQAALSYYRQAVAAFDEAISRQDDYAEAYNNRGNAYYRQGQSWQAIADFGQAIRCRPDYAEAYNNRAIAYNSLGKFRQAADDFGQAIGLDPDYADAYNNRGIAYSNMDDRLRALADYDQAIRLEAGRADFHYNRGNAYLNLGRYPQAVADFDRAIGANPDLPMLLMAYNNRGIANQALQKFERALADYEQAIRLKPDFADAYANRAAAYLLTGDLTKARADAARCQALGGQVKPELLERLRP